jgi:hypothetical protein
MLLVGTAGRFLVGAEERPLQSTTYWNNEPFSASRKHSRRLFKAPRSIFAIILVFQEKLLAWQKNCPDDLRRELAESEVDTKYSKGWLFENPGGFLDYE